MPEPESGVSATVTFGSAHSHKKASYQGVYPRSSRNALGGENGSKTLGSFFRLGGEKGREGTNSTADTTADLEATADTTADGRPS